MLTRLDFISQAAKAEKFNLVIYKGQVGPQILDTRRSLSRTCCGAGMTECRCFTVIPAKAGIQSSDYFQVTCAFWITRITNNQ